MLNFTLVPHYSWSTGWGNTIDYDSLDASAVALAECIIGAGMQQLPNNPYMIILNSSFLIDVLGSYQSGYSELQTAKKADPRCEGDVPENGRGGWGVLMVKPAPREVTPKLCIMPTVTAHRFSSSQYPCVSLLERFAIFSREQEHTQKQSGAANGESAVDLASARSLPAYLADFSFILNRPQLIMPPSPSPSSAPTPVPGIPSLPKF